MLPQFRSLALSVVVGRALLSLLRVRAAETADLEHWKQSVRTRFPQVTQIQTAELSAWLADTNRMPPVLLDVRTAPEFAMSHLPSAQRIDPSAAPATVRHWGSSNRPVVVYCSIGWRSSELASRLQKAGMTNLFNLEGSIFAWANEDRPLESGGKPAFKVHPYNRTFGRLLRPARRGEP